MTRDDLLPALFVGGPLVGATLLALRFRVWQWVDPMHDAPARPPVEEPPTNAFCPRCSRLSDPTFGGWLLCQSCDAELDRMAGPTEQHFWSTLPQRDRETYQRAAQVRWRAETRHGGQLV